MFFLNGLVPLIKPFITFEPAYILFNLASWISDLTDANFYLQKTCRYNVTLEPDIKTPCDDEKAGINFVATVNSEYVFAGSFLTIVITVFMSAWADKATERRKFCILFPMVLKLLQMIVMCLHSYFWHWPALYAVFTESTFLTATCMRIASIIYICSITTTEDRTFRLTFLYILQMITSIISSGSSGFLLRNLGFFYTYMICVILVSTAIFFVALFVKNIATESNPGFVKSVGDFFDIRSIIQAFKLVFRKRNGNERTIVCFLSAINIFAWVTIIGETNVLYLYLRYKFGWNEQDYGIYTLYKLIGISIGTMICLGLSKRFKVTDSALGTFAAFWDIFAAIGYFFATENWQLYLIPLLDIFHGFALNACDSLQSKFFEIHEFGRLFSVHVSLNAVLPFAHPAYNLLFKHTMDSMPQSVFLLSTAVNSITCILYGLCYIFMRTLPAKKE